MFKQAELSTWQTAAAINRLNNALPLFPRGSDASKFKEQEIVGLFEWLLPPQWRTTIKCAIVAPTFVLLWLDLA